MRLSSSPRPCAGSLLAPRPVLHGAVKAWAASPLRGATWSDRSSCSASQSTSTSTSSTAESAPCSTSTSRTSTSPSLPEQRIDRLMERHVALASALAFGLGLSLLVPESAHSSEAISGDALDVFRSFLDYVENSPQGALVFLVTVALLEMVPLLPTQPFSIAAGLMFGVGKGSLLVISAATAAAIGAFLISRGVGRKLAERVIVMETGDHGPVQAKLTEVQHTIRSGGPLQQLVAVTLLRLTPIVPFSASNYVLGLTPVGTLPYLSGTLIGATLWGVVYTSLGAASRELLDNGMDVGDLFADLSEQASGYSAVALRVMLIVGVLAAGAYAVKGRMDGPSTPSSSSSSSASSAGASAEGRGGASFGGKNSRNGKAKANAAAAVGRDSSSSDQGDEVPHEREEDLVRETVSSKQ